MQETVSESVPGQEPPPAVLLKFAMGYIIAQAISVAARLGVADLLKDGAKTAEEIAALTDADAPSVFRLLRTLAGFGIFKRDGENGFSNTPVSELLRSDVPGSMRALVTMIGEREHWRACGEMLTSVRTGEPAFDSVFGLPLFPYLMQNPDAAQTFDNAMSSFSSTVSQAVVSTYDFSKAQTIADIGGGHGLLLATVLKANPNVKGILFDQPQVAAGAKEKLEREGVADRCEIVWGDFFQSVPAGGDVYLMKHIIHDWNDRRASEILKNCGAAMKPGARLLLVESVVEEDDSPSFGKIQDLNMMVMVGGRERTAKEFAQLFEQTGFRLANIYPMPAPVQIIEAVKV